METIYRCSEALKPYPVNIGLFFASQKEKHSEKTILLTRPPGSPEFSPITWCQLGGAVEALAQAMLAFGVKPGQRVAILSENRREMLEVELAAFCIGAVATPIFYGYFPETVNFILRHSEAVLLFLADETQLQKVDQVGLLPHLKKRIVFEAVADDPEKKIVSLHHWLTIKKNSSAAEVAKRMALVKPEDPAFLMYTSGTTGDPKGVLLSHQNVMSQHQGISQVWTFGPGDRLLSYLPWHHCFGGIFEIFMALYNQVPMAIDHSRGKDLDLLIENWALIRPTFYFSVPAIYQALLTKIKDNPGLEAVIFHPHLKAVFTAAAPLPSALYEEFARRNVIVHEGWGLTESAPDITITRPNRKITPGIVGEVLPGVEITLTAESEVLARGPNIMLGYLKNPQATQAAIDGDGWLHTGDLGEMTPEGLRIIGRADGVFKLINGEKVPSALLENLLVSHVPFINRACVFGRGRACIVAILFVNDVALRSWGKKKELATEDLAVLAAHPEIQNAIAEGVKTVNEKCPAKYCHIRAFEISTQVPSLERGELTPTNKTCVPRVEKNYAAVIEKLYCGAGAELRGVV